VTANVFITIDTEEDQWGDYVSKNNSVENVYRLPELQRLFNRYGAIPTYLIDYPVASDNKAVNILSRFQGLGQCDIGMHCHPWNTPPIKEEISDHNSMMCNLEPKLVHSKLEMLHTKIEKGFGKAPSTFRTGRWGFGPWVADSLIRLQYKIDTSVSPFVDWSADGGPDYGNAPTGAYRLEPGEILKPRPDGRLMEVPATVGFYQKSFRRCQRTLKWINAHTSAKLRLKGILDRLGLLNFRWLSPELSSGEDMVRLAQTCLDNGSNYLNMSFHSNSMLPGCGPFVKDEDGLKRFLGEIETFLRFAAHKNLVFVPLSAACGNSPSSE
jgi:hypothetical protein